MEDVWESGTPEKEVGYGCLSKRIVVLNTDVGSIILTIPTTATTASRTYEATHLAIGRFSQPTTSSPHWGQATSDIMDVPATDRLAIAMAASKATRQACPPS